MSKLIRLRNGSLWSTSNGVVSLPVNKIHRLYSMNDDTTVVDDLSSAEQNNDADNMSGALMEYRHSFKQNCVFFDGTDDFVSLNTSLSDFISQRDEISISYWKVLDRTLKTDQQTIFVAEGSDGSFHISMRFDNDSNPSDFRHTWIDSNSNTTNIETNISVSKGNIYCVTGRYKRNSDIAQWVTKSDGEKISHPNFETNSRVKILNNDFPIGDVSTVRLGRRQTIREYKGSLGPVCVWNEAIGHEEHYAFFESTKP